MSVSDKLKYISRRDLFKLAGQYGMSSTLLAAGSFGGAMSLANLASAAESTYEKRFSKPAKHTFKFGAAGFNARNLLIERAGALEFSRDLEARTTMRICSVTVRTSTTSCIRLPPASCCANPMSVAMV